MQRLGCPGHSPASFHIERIDTFLPMTPVPPSTSIVDVLLHAPLLSTVLQFQHGLSPDLLERYAECKTMQPLLDWDNTCLYRLPPRYTLAATANDLPRKLPHNLAHLSALPDDDTTTLVSTNELCLHGDSPTSHVAFHLAILEGDSRIVRQWINFHGGSRACVVLTPAAMDFCARIGAQDLLRMLLATTPQRCTTRGVDAASKHGHLSTLMVLHEHHTSWSAAALDGAAFHGHLDVVTFLHAHGAPCTTLAMSGAASRGHLHVVRFLHERRDEGCTKWAMDAAAKHGHLDMVKFLHTNRREGCTDAALTSAAAAGHLHVVQYLWTHRPLDCPLLLALNAAHVHGRVHVTAYLEQQQSRPSSS
ncbi:hypothetical protein DYB34_005502 [Aphanomyces astaci]|uniref:Uncharacterized protein n=1 Tax=Aphanomyces astaci TaxID=112090 RepID=A0A3R6XB15_APHAT|nr:hypothetical protein DYB34_005502 [Aphanomyces astaci]